VSRICIVTGAGSGIGRASALALLQHDWTVVLAGRRIAKLEETAALAEATSERAVALSTDISQPDSVEALFGEVASRFGRLDLLFNNAGDSMPNMAVQDVPYDEWLRVVQTDVTGTFLVSQQAFRMMASQSPMGGRIINNGAPSAHVPRPNSVAFTVTKHAILGLTRALSLDGRDYNIACGQIDFGNVTPQDGSSQPAVRQADGALRVEPTIDVKHVVEAVLMMASLPLGVNVQYVTLLPTAMPYIGRG
jgi:NAD(P)-dependent dehydrogenase (short-subunit alcohol dehydrogenase family)